MKESNLSGFLGEFFGDVTIWRMQTWCGRALCFFIRLQVRVNATSEPGTDSGH
jgi:hypothetical protein